MFHVFLPQDRDLLIGKVFLRHVPAGTELIRQGDQDAMLVFVVTGMLTVLQQVVGKETQEVGLKLLNSSSCRGPPLNKKLFTVDCPSSFKSANQLIFMFF